MVLANEKPFKISAMAKKPGSQVPSTFTLRSTLGNVQENSMKQIQEKRLSLHHFSRHIEDETSESRLDASCCLDFVMHQLLGGS